MSGSGALVLPIFFWALRTARCSYASARMPPPLRLGSHAAGEPKGDERTEPATRSLQPRLARPEAHDEIETKTSVFRAVHRRRRQDVPKRAHPNRAHPPSAARGVGAGRFEPRRVAAAPACKTRRDDCPTRRRTSTRLKETSSLGALAAATQIDNLTPQYAPKVSSKKVMPPGRTAASGPLFLKKLAVRLGAPSHPIPS